MNYDFNESERTISVKYILILKNLQALLQQSLLNRCLFFSLRGEVGRLLCISTYRIYLIEVFVCFYCLSTLCGPLKSEIYRIVKIIDILYVN